MLVLVVACGMLTVCAQRAQDHTLVRRVIHARIPHAHDFYILSKRRASVRAASTSAVRASAFIWTREIADRRPVDSASRTEGCALGFTPESARDKRSDAVHISCLIVSFVSRIAAANSA